MTWDNECPIPGGHWLASWDSTQGGDTEEPSLTLLSAGPVRSEALFEIWLGELVWRELAGRSMAIWPFIEDES